MNVFGEKWIAINFPTEEDCTRFMTYCCGEGNYHSLAVRFKLTEFEHNNSYHAGDRFIKDGLVVNIKECNITQESPLPKINDYNPLILYDGDILQVGCEEIPFETVEKIYKAMVSKKRG